MKRLKGILGITTSAIAAALLSAGSALAYDDDYDGSLDGYDVIIGDTGDRASNWDSSDTRTYVRVEDSRGRTHEGYFDSIASAFFVLKEKYGRVRVIDIGVPDFGQKYNPRTYDDYGLIDGDRAWYFWDEDRYARGGLPLVYSFYDRRDAADFDRNHNGTVMDFEEVVYSLKRWEDSRHDRIYWRGYDSDRWDNRHWSSAWDHRWNGYGWDRSNGWALRLNVDRDGDIRSGGVRYRGNGVQVRVRGNDSGRSNNNNGRGNGGRTRGRDDRNDDRGNDNNNGNQDGKYKREKKREKNR